MTTVLAQSDDKSLNDPNRCKSINKTSQLQCSYPVKCDGFCGIHYNLSNEKGIAYVVPEKNDSPLSKQDILDCNLTEKFYRKVLQSTLAKYGMRKGLNVRKSLLMERFVKLKFLIENEESVKKIQKWYIKRLDNINLFYHGRGITERSICVNPTEFFTLDDIEEIPSDSFISLEENGFVYGFDADSIKTLFERNRGIHPQNPYTRQKIPKSFLDRVYVLQKGTTEKLIKARKRNAKYVATRFQIYYQAPKMRNLCKLIKDDSGFVLNPNWILNLTQRKIVHAIDSLHRIWYHINKEAKKRIFPKEGNLFSTSMVRSYSRCPWRPYQMHSLYKIIQGLTTMGVSKDDRGKGIIIFCAVLYVVSRPSRETLSWAANMDFDELTQQPTNVVAAETEAVVESVQEPVEVPVQDPLEVPVQDPLEVPVSQVPFPEIIGGSLRVTEEFM